VNLAEITPVVLTRDEDANIERTLRQLAWAQEVVVVDSGSRDGTLAIARSFANVRVAERVLDDLASQWTFGAAQATTSWVLTLDADYFVPDAFASELRALEPPPHVNGYEARFTYAIGGRPVRGSLYTPRAVLLRRGRFAFFMDGHTQRVRVDGDVASLATKLVHDDRKPFARFVARQRRYMHDEAVKLRATPSRALPISGRVRKLIVVAPLLVPLYALFVKGTILDGVAGLRYAFERLVAEAILSWELIRR
jgi:glycosyltransferase involved in cell wall biosynthesis